MSHLGKTSKISLNISEGKQEEDGLETEMGLQTLSAPSLCDCPSATQKTNCNLHLYFMCGTRTVLKIPLKLPEFYRREKADDAMINRRAKKHLKDFGRGRKLSSDEIDKIIYLTTCVTHHD